MQQLEDPLPKYARESACVERHWFPGTTGFSEETKNHVIETIFFNRLTSFLTRGSEVRKFILLTREWGSESSEANLADFQL